MTLEELSKSIENYPHYDIKYIDYLKLFIININSIEDIEHLKMQFWDMVAHKLILENDLLTTQERYINLQEETKDLILRGAI